MSEPQLFTVANLRELIDQLDDADKVVFYQDDGTDTPDEWEDGPHLAIAINDGQPWLWLHNVDGRDVPEWVTP